MGKGLAIAAKVFGFRPSKALHVEDPLMQIVVDVIAASVALEAESQPSTGVHTAGGKSVPQFSLETQRKIDKRMRKQEKRIKAIQEEARKDK